MNFKNIIKNSLFAKSFNLAKSNPNKVGLMILFDALFLVSFFYVLPYLTGYFAQNLVLPQTYQTLFILIIFQLLYYLAVLFVYSFFKYSILDFIKSLFESSEFSFKRLSQFYILNFILILPAYALFNIILASTKVQYRPLIFFALSVPLTLLLYLIINASHSLFYHGNSIKKSIKKGFIIVFTKIKNYREIILIFILFALLLFILFFSGGYLIRILASKNYNLYLNYYTYFKQISIIIIDLVLYFIILINRISFYAITRELE